MMYILYNSDGSIKRHWTTERAKQVILSIDAEMLKGVVNNQTRRDFRNS